MCFTVFKIYQFYHAYIRTIVVNNIVLFRGINSRVESEVFTRTLKDHDRPCGADGVVVGYVFIFHALISRVANCVGSNFAKFTRLEIKLQIRARIKLRIELYNRNNISQYIFTVYVNILNA